MQNSTPEPIPPPKKLKTTSPKTWAGGLPAVASAMGYIQREAGLVRGNQILLKLNQKDGFDCPSCAWPDPDDERSRFEYCENGAKAVAWETTKRRVEPEFFSKWSIEALREQSDHWLESQGRLTHPMLIRKGDDHYSPIAWDEAFALLGKELNSLKSPNEATFYTSGRTSNEAAFLYQLFARKFGTNNLPDCSNMCHESSGAALSETIGIGKGTVSLDDIHQAEAIFLFGQNPGTNHPRMLSALQKAAENGCQIVAINPLREAGLTAFAHPQQIRGVLGRATPLASQFLQVKLNGDQALIQGLCKAIFEAEIDRPEPVLDHEFIRSHTTGVKEFGEFIAQLSWSDIEHESGITQSEIERAAEIAITSNKTIACWAMGLTQHRNAVATIQDVVNFLLLRGNLGKPGAGVCPVRGHSNVQGDRTMGICEKPTAMFLEKLQATFGFTPPHQHGLDTVESIHAMLDQRVRVFFAMGGNFLSATPDTDRTTRALSGCRITAQVSTKLNRSHLFPGEIGLILPCLGRSENDIQTSGPQFVSMENSMGVVHRSQGRLIPASPYLLSEPAIVCRMARTVFGEHSKVDWTAYQNNYDAIRESIAKTIPGFENYNQRIRKDGGFYLRNSAKELDFSGIGGRAKFMVNARSPLTLKKNELLLMTIRSHDQFNTTVYGPDDRYRGISGERRIIFLNQEDMREREITEAAPVEITSHFEGQQRTVRMFLAVPYDIPRGCAAAYFPETNPLVPLESTALKSNTPTSKSIVITLKPSV